LLFGAPQWPGAAFRAWIAYARSSQKNCDAPMIVIATPVLSISLLNSNGSGKPSHLEPACWTATIMSTYKDHGQDDYGEGVESAPSHMELKAPILAQCEYPGASVANVGWLMASTPISCTDGAIR
jgi:hypothetical protein